MAKFNVQALVAAAAVSTVVSGAVTSARLTVAQMEPPPLLPIGEMMPREMPPPPPSGEWQSAPTMWHAPMPGNTMQQWRPDMREDRQPPLEMNEMDARFPRPMHGAPEGMMRGEDGNSAGEEGPRTWPMHRPANGPMNAPMNGSMNGPWNAPMNGVHNGPMNAPMNGTMNGPWNAPMNGTMNGSTNGINGMHGLNGINGINGMNGLNGINSMNGLNGLNGINGMNGLNGINGINSLQESMGEGGAMPRPMPRAGNEMQQWKQMQGGLEQLLSDDDTDIEEAEAMIERMEEMLGKIDSKQAKLLEKKSTAKSAIARKLIDRKLKSLDRIEGEIRDQLAEFESMFEEEDYEESAE